MTHRSGVSDDDLHQRVGDRRADYTHLHSTPFGDVHIFRSVALPASLVITLFSQHFKPRFGLSIRSVYKIIVTLEPISKLAVQFCRFPSLSRNATL